MPAFFKDGFSNLLLRLSIGILVCLVAAITIGSIARYGFAAGSVKLEDFIRYTFGVLILLSILVAFFKHAHVRVTMLSNLRSNLDKPLFRILSALPFVVIALLSLTSIQFSWSVLEGSRDSDGLGGLFLVKTLLPISFMLIAAFLCFGRKDNQK